MNELLEQLRNGDTSNIVPRSRAEAFLLTMFEKMSGAGSGSTGGGKYQNILTWDSRDKQGTPVSELFYKISDLTPTLEELDGGFCDLMSDVHGKHIPLENGVNMANIGMEGLDAIILIVGSEVYFDCALFIVRKAGIALNDHNIFSETGIYAQAPFITLDENGNNSGEYECQVTLVW